MLQSPTFFESKTVPGIVLKTGRYVTVFWLSRYSYTPLCCYPKLTPISACSRYVSPCIRGFFPLHDHYGHYVTATAATGALTPKNNLKKFMTDIPNSRFVSFDTPATAHSWLLLFKLWSQAECMEEIL